jgi:hypothetical protein
MIPFPHELTGHPRILFSALYCHAAQARSGGKKQLGAELVDRGNKENSFCV